MRPGGPLQSCGKIMLGDRLVRVDDICCANLKMQSIKDLVLGKVGSKVSLHFTRETVVVTVHLHREAAPAPHLNMSRSPLHPPASEACSAHSSNQAPSAGILAHRDAIHNRDCANVYPQYDRFAPSDYSQLCGIGMSLRRKLCHDDPTQCPSWKVSSMSAGGPLATTRKVRVGDRLVRVNALDCEDWNLQRIKDEVLGKEGSEVRLVFGMVMGFERVELLRAPKIKLTLVDPMEASCSGRTPDAEEVAIQPEPLAKSSASENPNTARASEFIIQPEPVANSSASEILNTAIASTSTSFHPPAPEQGIQGEKTGELEPSDMLKLHISSLQPSTPAAGSGFGSPAVPLETILCPTNSTTSLSGTPFGGVAITETQEPNDSRSSCLLPKGKIPKRGSKSSYMEGRGIIQVGNVAHRFKLYKSVTVEFILEDLSASNAQLACRLVGATI